MRFVAASAQKRTPKQSAHVELPRESATLVSGQGLDLFDDNVERRPHVALGPEEWRAHADAMARERANYLPEGATYK